MALERARRRKLAQLVPDHVFGHINGDELAPVMDGDGVADHVGEDGGAARPGTQDLLIVGLVHDGDLLLKMRVDEGTFLG